MFIVILFDINLSIYLDSDLDISAGIHDIE